MGIVTLEALTEAALTRQRKKRAKAAREYATCSENCTCCRRPEELTPEILDEVLVATYHQRPSPAGNVRLLLLHMVDLKRALDEKDEVIAVNFGPSSKELVAGKHMVGEMTKRRRYG